MLYYVANHDAGNAGDIALNYATGRVLDMIDIEQVDLPMRDALWDLTLANVAEIKRLIA